MKFSIFSVIAALASTVIASPMQVTNPDSSTTGPDPAQINVKKITYNGSGCPSNSVSGVISPDGTAFTLFMSSYIASFGTGVPISDSIKSCSLNVYLTYPSGWQFSIFKATYRGSAVLDAGVTGTQSARYWFTGAGSDRQVSAQSQVKGPYNNDYTITDSTIVTSEVWSPCGQAGLLNMLSTVKVQGKNGLNGIMTTDTIDGSFQQIYAIQWRQCK